MLKHFPHSLRELVHNKFQYSIIPIAKAIAIKGMVHLT